MNESLQKAYISNIWIPRGLVNRIDFFKSFLGTNLGAFSMHQRNDMSLFGACDLTKKWSLFGFVLLYTAVYYRTMRAISHCDASVHFSRCIQAEDIDIENHQRGVLALVL